MTEHTPGPWEWQELDGSDEHVELWAIEADASVVILDSGFAISTQSDSTWPADKALIAAAPETKRQRDDALRLIKQAVPFVIAWSHNHGDGEKPSRIGMRLAKRMQAAIDKVKGERP